MNKLISIGVEEGTRAAAAGIEKVIRNYFTDDEYRLYTTMDDEYARTFVSGLVELSESHPIVIAHWRYDWISGQRRLDSQWRSLVLKPLLKQSVTLGVVIASRINQQEDYGESFQGERDLIYTSDLQPLTAAEISAAYEFQPDLIERIIQRTSGIPLDVGAFITHLKQTGREPEGPELVVGEKEATQRRFTRYLSETPQDPPEVAHEKRITRHRVYALALLRRADPSALAACWGSLEKRALTPDDVLERYRDLRQRCEFLFEHTGERMQLNAWELVREELRQKAQPDSGSLEREVIRQLNDAAAGYYEQALRTRESASPSLNDRIADAEWRSLRLGALNHQFWLDERAAIRDYVCRLLEAANFRGAWLPELRSVASEAALDDPLMKVFDLGVAALLADDPPNQPIRTMWDEVEQRRDKWKLNAVHRALLANHRGKLFARLELPARAAEELKKGLDELGETDETALREYLVDGLAASAAMFAFGERNYAEAVSVARLALSYDPRHRTAKHMAVLGYLGLKAFDSAHQLLNELIEAYPDAVEFRSARYTAYLAENRNEDAKKELAEIFRIRPSFAEDLVKSILDHSDPKFQKSLADWGQDVGWTSGGPEELLRLQQLPEEILTELMTAQFKLLATTPTPEQVVSLRELFASRLPDWPSLQIQLGSAYLAVGRVPDAVAAFERARAISPDDPSSLSVSAMTLSSFGHYDEAEPFLQASASLLPDNPGPDLLMISNLLDRGRTNEAREHAEITIKKFPDKSMVRWLYGAVLLQTAGEEQKGWTEMKAAYRADPTVIETTIKGWSVRPPEALEKLRQTIASEGGGEISEVLASLPSHEMLRLYMEIVRARLEANEEGQEGEPNPDVLIPPLEELLTHRPNSIELRFVLSNQYRRAGKPDRAIPLLTEVLARASSEEAQTLRSLLYGLYLKTGEYRLSLEQLQKIDQPGALEYQAMAMLHEQFGEFREALAASDKAIAASEHALTPATDEDAEQIGRYGLYNLTAGRLERAEELIRAQLSRQPDDPVALSNLAEILFCKGELREARTAALRSLDLDQTSALATARMARISEAMKLEEEAERYRVQAIQRLPGASDYDQACALAVLGREEEALARLADAVKGDPTIKGWATCDPDFRTFHGNSEFKRIVSV